MSDRVRDDFDFETLPSVTEPNAEGSASRGEWVEYGIGEFREKRIERMMGTAGR